MTDQLEKNRPAAGGSKNTLPLPQFNRLPIRGRRILELALVMAGLLVILELAFGFQGGRATGSLFVVWVAGHLLLVAVLLAGMSALRHDEQVESAAEASLRSGESRLRSILETAVDAIVTIDENGLIESVNPAVERSFGYDRGELVGQNVSRLMASPERENHDAHLARYRRTGERRIIGIGREVVCRRRDGSVFPADLAVGEFRSGSERKFTGFLRDLTDKKQRERLSLRAQRLESIGTLAGGIAHDLNNMLTPILMSVGLLRKERPAVEREALLSNIRSSAERGAEMVRQLLSFTGGLETQSERIHPADVVREIRALLEHTLPKSIAIRCELAADLRPVLGDATQIAQVLMNLCVNARDAMPQGGELTISAANRDLDDADAAPLPDARAGRYVELAVSDTGAGIPADVIDRVFDPFFTTKPHGQGTGLGLSTVLGIARSHGGFATASSRPGGGARFAVLLPAHDAPRSQERPASGATPSAGRGELVLIVDDEQLIRDTVRPTLEEAGFRVAAAADGEAATQFVRAHPGEARVALVDMMLPGADGLATMRALRELQADLRLIATSGVRIAEEAAEGVARLAAAQLPKPFSNEQLLLSIGKALRPPPSDGA